jgi:hypothetical protein
MNDLLYLFIEIVWATNEKNKSPKVDADVFFPVPLLSRGKFGTCDNAHRLPIQRYRVHFVLPK